MFLTHEPSHRSRRKRPNESGVYADDRQETLDDLYFLIKTATISSSSEVFNYKQQNKQWPSDEKCSRRQNKMTLANGFCHQTPKTNFSGEVDQNLENIHGKESNSPTKISTHFERNVSINSSNNFVAHHTLCNSAKTSQRFTSNFNPHHENDRHFGRLKETEKTQCCLRPSIHYHYIRSAKCWTPTYRNLFNAFLLLFFIDCVLSPILLLPLMKVVLNYVAPANNHISPAELTTDYLFPPCKESTVLLPYCNNATQLPECLLHKQHNLLNKFQFLASGCFRRSEVFNDIASKDQLFLSSFESWQLLSKLYSDCRHRNLCSSPSSLNNSEALLTSTTKRHWPEMNYKRGLIVPHFVSQRNFRTSSFFAVATASSAVAFFSSCLSVKCDERDMQQCLQYVQPILTNTSLGYAVNGAQVEQVCQLFRQGMRCVDDFVNKCFDESRRLIFRQSIKGAENVMNKLCYDHHFQAEYIRHAKCYVQLSDKYERCTDAFRRRMALTANEHDLERRILLMCSALQTYLDCAYTISYRRCGLHAAMFLKKYTQEAAGDLVSKACEKYLDNNFTHTITEDPFAYQQHQVDQNGVVSATSILSALFTTTTTTVAPHRRHHTVQQHQHYQRTHPTTTSTTTTTPKSALSSRTRSRTSHQDDDDNDESLFPPIFNDRSDGNEQQQQQRQQTQLNSAANRYRPEQQLARQPQTDPRLLLSQPSPSSSIKQHSAYDDTGGGAGFARDTPLKLTSTSPSVQTVPTPRFVYPTRPPYYLPTPAQAPPSVYQQQHTNQAKPQNDFYSRSHSNNNNQQQTQLTASAAVAPASGANAVSAVDDAPTIASVSNILLAMSITLAIYKTNAQN